ncbi:hypothetical protein D3C75_1281380 [compost metagenome]
MEVVIQPMVANIAPGITSFSVSLRLGAIQYSRVKTTNRTSSGTAYCSRFHIFWNP